MGILDFFSAEAEELAVWAPEALRALLNRLRVIFFWTIALYVIAAGISWITERQAFLTFFALGYLVFFVFLNARMQTVQGALLLVAVDAGIDLGGQVKPTWAAIKKLAQFGASFPRLKELASLTIAAKTLYHLVLTFWIGILIIWVLPIWVRPDLIGPILFLGMGYAMFSTEWGKSHPWSGIKDLMLLASLGLVMFYAYLVYKDPVNTATTGVDPVDVAILAVAAVAVLVILSPSKPKSSGGSSDVH